MANSRASSFMLHPLRLIQANPTNSNAFLIKTISLSSTFYLRRFSKEGTSIFLQASPRIHLCELSPKSSTLCMSLSVSIFFYSCLFKHSRSLSLCRIQKRYNLKLQDLQERKNIRCLHNSCIFIQTRALYSALFLILQSSPFELMLDGYSPNVLDSIDNTGRFTNRTSPIESVSLSPTTRA